MSRRVLVTGASGYIGSRVCRFLSEGMGWAVTALVRPSSDLSLLSAAAPSAKVERTGGSFKELSGVLRRVRPDAVAHLAAAFSAGPEAAGEVVSANVAFGTLLLEAMSAVGVDKFVNTGTFWDRLDGKAYRPLDLYAACKKAFADVMAYYEDARGLKAVTLRLFAVYGPEDSRGKVFSLMKKSLAGGPAVALSPGRQVLDFVHVDDAAAAYGAALEYLFKKKAPKPEVVDVGSGKGLSLRQAATVFERVAGKPLNVAWGGVPYRPREVMRAVADLGPARKILGWRPRRDLASGIAELLGH